MSRARTDQDLQTADRLLKAFADPTRLRIVRLLLGGEVCVCDIHQSLKIPQPKASRHLAYLRRSGVVNTRRNGPWIYYRLAKAEGEIARKLFDAVCECVCCIPATGKDLKQLQQRTGCC
jgi:ArsR family transcriptional regulator